jgi:hypothetical protein
MLITTLAKGPSNKSDKVGNLAGGCRTGNPAQGRTSPEPRQVPYVLHPRLFGLFRPIVNRLSAWYGIIIIIITTHTCFRVRMQKNAIATNH